jgi:flagellar M-ring protein FliF
VRSIPAADASIGFKTPALAAETVSEERGSKATHRSESPAARDGSRPRLRLKKGPTLKDDLVELVKEDPDGAAAILRTWIGNAG